MLERSIAIAAVSVGLAFAGCDEARAPQPVGTVGPLPPSAAEVARVPAMPAKAPAKAAPTPAAPGAEQPPPAADPAQPNVQAGPQPTPPTKPSPGGQSGGEGSETCTITELALSEATTGGVPVRDVWGALERALQSELRLDWRPKSTPPAATPQTRLVISNVQFGPRVTVDCQGLESTIEFDARSEDGQLEGHFAGPLTGTTYWGDRDLTIAATLRTGDLDGHVRVSISSNAELTLTLRWRDGDPQVVSGVLNADMDGIGWIHNDDFPIWIPVAAPAFDIVPSDVQRAACAGASATVRATFDSEDSARQSLAKRWILCDGQTNVDFVGLEIDSTGHWRALRLAGDKLVPAQGFGYEGEVLRSIHVPEEFNLELLDVLPDRHAFYNVALSADGNTMRLDSHTEFLTIVHATLHATDLSVSEAPAKFEHGARAGQAACTVAPTDLVTRPISIDALRELLVGSWTFCRGRLGTKHPGVRFEADGRVAFLAADGTVAEEGSYVIWDTSSQNGIGAYQINLNTKHAQTIFGSPMFASTPLMLMPADASQSVLSAM